MASTSNFTTVQIDSWITKSAQCLLTYESKWKGDSSLSYHFAQTVVSETSKTHSIPVNSLKVAILEEKRWQLVVQAALRMKEKRDSQILVSSVSTKDRMSGKRALEANGGEAGGVSQPAKKKRGVLGGLLNKMGSNHTGQAAAIQQSSGKIIAKPLKQLKVILPENQSGPNLATTQKRTATIAFDPFQAQDHQLAKTFKDSNRITNPVALRDKVPEIFVGTQGEGKGAAETTFVAKTNVKDSRNPKKRFLARRLEEESQAESTAECAAQNGKQWQHGRYKKTTSTTTLPQSMGGGGHAAMPSYYMPIMSPVKFHNRKSISSSTDTGMQALNHDNRSRFATTHLNTGSRVAEEQYTERPSAPYGYCPFGKKCTSPGCPCYHFTEEEEATLKPKEAPESRDSVQSSNKTAPSGEIVHVNYFDDLFGKSH